VKQEAVISEMLKMSPNQLKDKSKMKVVLMLHSAFRSSLCGRETLLSHTAHSWVGRFCILASIAFSVLDFFNLTICSP